MKIWRWLFALTGWALVLGAGVGILFLATHKGRSLVEVNRWLRAFSSFHWVSHWALGLGLILLALESLNVHAGAPHRIIQMHPSAGPADVSRQSLAKGALERIGVDPVVIQLAQSCTNFVRRVRRTYYPAIHPVSVRFDANLIFVLLASAEGYAAQNNHE